MANGEIPSQPDQIPPVPQLPDMHHRGGSPNTHTPTMMTLQSPYGHVPPEHYQQQQHMASPTQASFYHPHPHTQSPGGHPQQQQAGQGDYGGYYGAHPGYLMHQQQQQQHQGQQQQQQMYGDSRQRMMLEGGRNLGMGYVGPGGHGQGDV
jgi:hypothetical protein